MRVSELLLDGSVVLVLFVLGACDDGGTGPDQDADQATGFALAALGMMGSAGPGVGGPLPQTLPCPSGGSRVIDGTTHSASGAGVHTVEWNLSMEYRDCALRIDTMSIELDGATRSEGRSRVRAPAQGGQRPTVLELESRDRGQMTTRTNGRTQTCSFDMTQRFDPVKNEIRLTGTSCGHKIDISRPVL
jgi:hypothetical protein